MESYRQDLYMSVGAIKTKSEKSTRLAYTGLLGELEHVKKLDCIKKLQPRLV